MLTDRLEDLADQAKSEADNVLTEAARAKTQSDAYEALTHASNLTWTAQELVAAAVESARLWGMTWEAIGDVFGISKQAAHERWG